jgi:hypothetical protein
MTSNNNMTAKEKAVQLFNKYYVSILEVNNDLSEEIIISILAKKHALIAVDEMLKVAFYLPPDCYNFYLNVKVELSNL